MAHNQPPSAEVATILACEGEAILVSLRDSVRTADLARLHDLVGSRVFTELVNFTNPPVNANTDGPPADPPLANTYNRPDPPTAPDSAGTGHWGYRDQNGGASWADASAGSEPPTEAARYV